MSVNSFDRLIIYYRRFIDDFVEPLTVDFDLVCDLVLKMNKNESNGIKESNRLIFISRDIVYHKNLTGYGIRNNIH